MAIVTKLPNVSAQCRVFISGRSKSTWHVTYIHRRGRGETAGKNVGRKTGGCVYFYKTKVGFGLKIWGGYNE